MGLDLYYLLLIFALYNSHILECFRVINQYYKTYNFINLKGENRVPAWCLPHLPGASQPSSDHFTQCMLARQVGRHASTVLP